MSFLPNNIDLIIIGVLAVFAIFLSYRSLLKAFLASIFLIPLMHKELFSLVIWDFLPVRAFLLGMLFFYFLYTIRWFFKHPRAEFIYKIKEFFLYDPFLILLALLWLARAVSIYNSASPLESLALLAFYSLAIFYYILFRYIIQADSSAYTKILKTYLFVGIPVGLFAVLQFYLRLCCRETIGGVWVVPNVLPRLGSTFWDVNHYGGYLITLIPLAFSFVFITKKIHFKIFNLIYVLFLCWLLFMTQSRSSWIGLSVGMILSFAIYYWAHLKKPLLFVTGVGALAIIAVMVVAVIKGIDLKAKYANYMHYRLDSTDTHFMLIDASAEVFEQNFFLGSGYGTFDSAFRKTEIAEDYFDREPALRDMKVPSHSVWGEILAESGAVGITLYSALILLLFCSLIYTIFNEQDARQKYLGIGIIGAMVSVMTSGIFYSYNMEFFWLALFIGIGYVLKANNFRLNVLSVSNWWNSSNFSPYLIIAPLALFFIFIKLGTNALIDVDEAIYAKVAKNILLTGNWLSLHWDSMNDFWFEKPPLYMWLTAGMFQILGYREFAARFWSAFAGLLCVILVYKIGTKMYNRLAGIFSALMLLSTIHFLYYARNGMLDVSVTLFLIISFYFFYKIYKNYADVRLPRLLTWSLLAGAAIGLGVMTKAIIGLLLLPIYGIFMFYLMFKHKNLKGLLSLIIITVGILIVAGPWHWYEYQLYGQDFLGDYFYDHILKRGMSGLGHEQPILWYLSVIKTSFRLWVAPLVAGLVFLPFIDKERKREYILLTVIAAYIFAFFSYSEDKLQWYIIPIYPFLALLAGRFTERALFYINSTIVKKEYAANPALLRFAALVAMVILSAFTIAWNQNKVYYDDFNKDKVALIKIHNNAYPLDKYPNRKLYYNKVGQALMLFYSDQKVSSVSRDDIIRKIEEADPNETFSFLTTSSMFYSVQNEAPGVNFPLVLDVKGSAGDWVLYRSKSRVELLKLEYSTVSADLAKVLNIPVYWRTTQDNINIRRLGARQIELQKQLAAYGYPIVVPTPTPVRKK